MHWIYGQESYTQLLTWEVITVQGGEHWFEARVPALNQGSTLDFFLTLGKLLNTPVPQFPHIYSNNYHYLMVCLVAQSCPTLCDPMDCSPPGSSVHGDSPGKNTGVACHSLLQGISPSQGSNPDLPDCRWILYHLSHQGSPYLMGLVVKRELKWVNTRKALKIVLDIGRTQSSLPVLISYHCCCLIRIKQFKICETKDACGLPKWKCLKEDKHMVQKLKGKHVARDMDLRVIVYGWKLNIKSCWDCCKVIESWERPTFTVGIEK